MKQGRGFDLLRCPSSQGSWWVTRAAASSGPLLLFFLVKTKDALHLAGEVPTGVYGSSPTLPLLNSKVFSSSLVVYLLCQHPLTLPRLTHPSRQGRGNPVWWRTVCVPVFMSSGTREVWQSELEGGKGCLSKQQWHAGLASAHCKPSCVSPATVPPFQRILES